MKVLWLFSVLDCSCASVGGQWRQRMMMKVLQNSFKSLSLVEKGPNKSFRPSRRRSASCHYHLLMMRRDKKKRSLTVAPKGKKPNMVRRTLWQNVPPSPLPRRHLLASNLASKRVMTAPFKTLEARGSVSPARNFVMLTRDGLFILYHVR
jgi:hypothetical protein